MAFAQRQIDLVLALANGTLNDRNDNIVSLKGLRCDVIVMNTASDLAKSSAQIRVYGLNMDTMQKFNTVGRNVIQQRNDEITISAGDAVRGIREIFRGTIAYANVNLHSAPHVPLDMFATPGLFYQMLPSAANSYPGQVDVASIVSGLATRMGMAFENHGVTTKVADHYLHGTLMDQLLDVCRAANIVCSLENNTVRIWPNDSFLDEPAIEVSSSSGLIGYPTFTPVGLRVEMEFRNDVLVGRRMNLKSSVPQATGEWYINNMQHELSTLTPHGPWKTVALISQMGLARAK